LVKLFFADPWFAMLRSLTLLTLALLVAAPASALAQTNALVKRIQLTGENPQIGNRLHALDQQLNLWLNPGELAKMVAWSAPAWPWRPCAGWLMEDAALEKWEQGLSEYLKLLDEAGDALVPVGLVPAGNELPPACVQLRRLIHARLAAMPSAILQRYRRRVDAQAQKLLVEGREQRNPAPLRRLVDESFCSRDGDQTLDLLGDLAFERGNFEEALAWWRLLALPPTEARRPSRAELLFPDSKIDPALIRAKEVLAFAFFEQRQRAERELAAFRLLHPDAQGTLAGAAGPYAQILATWIKKLAAHGPVSNQVPWTTFSDLPGAGPCRLCPESRTSQRRP
jgi:hypothetical protein